MAREVPPESEAADSFTRIQYLADGKRGDGSSPRGFGKIELAKAHGYAEIQCDPAFLDIWPDM
jgi:hypothetical protein